MDNEKRSDDQNHLEQHSLPGTNMAGKGASTGDRGTEKIPEREHQHDDDAHRAEEDTK